MKVRIVEVVLAFSCLLSPTLSSPVPNSIAAVDYDVIIIGGGPAGLSALSGLSRVRRKAVMLDSGMYRNAATRHMHDVIGNDGKTCSLKLSGRSILIMNRQAPSPQHFELWPASKSPGIRQLQC